MSKGSAQNSTTHQYHTYAKIHRVERPTSALSGEIASNIVPKPSTYVQTMSTAPNPLDASDCIVVSQQKLPNEMGPLTSLTQSTNLNIVSSVSSNPLNASNLTILNLQNQQSKLKQPIFLTQSTNPSTTSVKARSSYDGSDNEAAPVEWTAATAATAAFTTAAAACAGNNKEEPRCEHDNGQGITRIAWGMVNTADDPDVPDWELIDDVDANEEWNALDVLDRVAVTRDVEGWSFLSLKTVWVRRQARWGYNLNQLGPSSFKHMVY